MSNVIEAKLVAERLRVPISESMFLRKCDMLRALFAERSEAADIIESLCEKLAAAEKALEKIEQCAERNLGRQTEKLADIAPMARAALAAIRGDVK